VRAKRVKALLLHFSFSLDASRNHDSEVLSKGCKVAGVEGENRRSLAVLGTRADNGVVGATARYAFFRSEPKRLRVGPRYVSVFSAFLAQGTVLSDVITSLSLAESPA